MVTDVLQLLGMEVKESGLRRNEVRDMRQQTFSDIEYNNRRKRTRKELFLDQMDLVVPWQNYVDRIRPHYPEGKRGRPPRNIEMMLRMYLMKSWFGLSDQGIEDAVYDSYAMHKFMHLDFLDEQVPDATTLLKFRHLMDSTGIGKEILEDINSRLKASGKLLRRGKNTDAALIFAPNQKKQRGTDNNE